MNKFYVYKWINLDSGEVFYIGKGSRDRHRSLSHRNKLFLDYIKNNPNYSNEIIEYFDNEYEAYQKEELLIQEMKPCCNIALGGYGGFSIVWTDEMRKMEIGK